MAGAPPPTKTVVRVEEELSNTQLNQVRKKKTDGPRRCLWE